MTGGTVAFAATGPDDPRGRPQRTITVPDPGPNNEILVFYWPVARELLADQALDLGPLADHVAKQISARAREAILNWEPADGDQP